MKKNFFEIDSETEIRPEKFYSDYVDKGFPVKIPSFLKLHNMAEKWSFSYFQKNMFSQMIPVKRFLGDGKVDVTKCSMGSYVDALNNYESQGDKLEKYFPPYCHDLPIFNMCPQFKSDVVGFDTNYLPKWYRDDWCKYAQFFMSPSGSVTPLHYDTLLTHNLFFQVKGKKEFIILPKTEKKYCYRMGWRWFSVDPTADDFSDFEDFKNAKAFKVCLEPGDVLFMPAGTLHYVKTIEASISFNVDFHTCKSVLSSFKYVFDKMPIKNIFYNSIIFLGVVVKIPSKLIFKYYKSYLNYVS